MLRVEIASTPAMHSQGLMYRTKLGEDEGMAFIFNKSDNLQFWGVNTFIPLDIAFVNKNYRIERISQIKPMQHDLVKSEKPCCIAIEANLGYFDSRGIKVGDKIQIDRDKGIIEFDRGSGDLITRLAQQVIDWDRDIIGPDDLSNILEDEYDDENFQPEKRYWEQDGGLDEGPASDELEFMEYDPNAQFPEEQEYMESPEFDGEIKSPPEVPIPDKEYPEFDSIYDAASWAENNGESMHIWYQTMSGRDIERDVEPHGQFMARTTGNPILVTFDDTIGDIRAFIMNQILNYSFTGRKFEKKFLVG